MRPGDEYQLLVGFLLVTLLYAVSQTAAAQGAGYRENNNAGEHPNRATPLEVCSSAPHCWVLSETERSTISFYPQGAAIRRGPYLDQPIHFNYTRDDGAQITGRTLGVYLSCYTGFIWQNVAPFTYGGWACVDGTCPEGKTRDTNGNCIDDVPPAPLCTVKDPDRTVNLNWAIGGRPPEYICLTEPEGSSCRYQNIAFSIYGDKNLTYDFTHHEATYTDTVTNCVEGDLNVDYGSTKPLPEENCILGENGLLLCWDQHTACGTFNGRRLCSADLPLIPTLPADCYLVPGGYICAGTGLGYETPPLPLNPPVDIAPGSRVSQSSFSSTNLGTSIRNVFNYYGSSGSGPLSRHSTTPLDGGNAPATSEDIKRLSENLIDEGGITDLDPSELGDLVSDRFGDLAEQAETGIGELAENFYSLPENTPLKEFTYSSCQSIDYIFAGYEFSFPGVAGCALVETMKDIVGWIFIFFTAIHIFNLLLNIVGVLRLQA